MKKSIKFILFPVIFLLLIIQFMDLSSTTDFKSINNSYDIHDKNLKTSNNSGPQLSFYNFLIDDDNSGSSQGDNDGEIDAGETIEVRLRLQNSGDEDAQNVNATITSSDKNVTIITAFQDFITIPKGETGVSASFYVFKIKSNCSSDYNITLNLEIKASNGGPWNDNFQIYIMGESIPVFYTYSIYSESDGDLPADDDDIIDAGEIVDFYIFVKNLGDANLYGITGIISENDPYITINDNYGVFDNINSNGGTNSGRFKIRVSGTCPDKHQIDFNLNLTDNEGTKWKLTFFLIVNGTSAYEIVDFSIIEYEGDGDDKVDAGETWYAKITIRNNGSAIGHSVYVFLDTSDSHISFNSYSRNINYGTININETVSNADSYYWRFTVSDTTPANHVITFSIRITDNSGYKKYFNESISVIGVSAYEIVDFSIIEYEGDGDDKVDAGETWYANITIKNNGSAIGHSVNVFLKTSDSHVSFYYSASYRIISYGTIKVNETVSNADSYYWRFTVSDTIPAGHVVTFSIRITDISGYKKYFHEPISVIGVSDYEIADFSIIEYEGDGDDKVEAGESWYANITIRNKGFAISHSVNVFFDSSDTSISFLASSDDRVINYGTIDVNETISNGFCNYWLFTISNATPANHIINFSIRITDSFGYKKYFYKSITVIGKYSKIFYFLIMLSIIGVIIVISEIIGRYY
ncbi:MAG: hypothetical protein ACTSQS_06955 [Promethearchaeota archaeon]